MKHTSIKAGSQLVRTLPQRRWIAPVAAFLAMMLALPGAANVTIPDQPLTLGARIPPNILFILDNSGSMGDVFLPDSAPKTGWGFQTAARNKIYYDPSVTYKPWVDSRGTEMTGGDSYNSAYSDTSLVPPFSTATTNLQLAVQTFYIPKVVTTVPSTLERDYWRYQIHLDGRIVRSELLQGAHPEGELLRGCEVGSSGTTWRWKNCTFATPTPRTEANELRNFALWYSYHRTRMKVAKSSAGRAFAEIGPEYRVGYRNIYNNMPTNNNTIPGGGIWPTGGKWNTHPITPSKPIPVARNAGLFDDPNGTTGADNNKTAWFQRLYAQNASGSTPLRLALYQAGEYFKTDHDDNGPWGPGEGTDQYACRQNFTLLTTDGYRNDDDNASLWNGQIGEEDNVAGPTISVPRTFTYAPAPPYSSPHSGNLADIAMHYWRSDLRTDLNNVVPTSDANPAFWQHMVTFGVSLGAAGTLDPKTDLPAITAGTKVWPYHKNLKPESIDDFWHATVNGRGEFIMAGDGDAFIEGLRNTLNTIKNRLGSFSNVAVNSVSLDSDSKVFSASYRSGEWSGQLSAREASSSGIGSVIWTASLPTWSARKVFTSNGALGQDFPTSAQLALLARGGAPTNFPVTGVKNAEYIKGDGSAEERNGGLLRDRTTALGDIIGSSPAYIADTNTLYVGANDGMLHAFDATTGQELFAYIPNNINWGNLSTLSRGDYAHRYFVDGPIAVTSQVVTPSENILVGSLGRGGKGLYALDVTNPASATASGVFKWERSTTPGDNMGFVLGKPLLSGLYSGSVGAVIGNGVNSVNNKAVLLVIDVDTGNVIREIDTGAGSVAFPNGLSAPTGVYGIDGKTLAYVYAGDLLGNVWKFDLTSSTPSAWTAHKLFTAGDGNGSQPISAAVTVATHPRTFKRWVLFGTGRYLTAEDADPLLSGTTQSMYGFIENNSDTLEAADLTQRNFEVTSGSVDGIPVRAFEGRSPLPAGSQGWYVDLPGTAERIVQDAQVVSGYLITASMTPTGDACEPDGSGYWNAVDAFTGTSPGNSFFDLDRDGYTDDSVISGGGQSLPVGSINVGVGMPTLPSATRFGLLGCGSNAECGFNPGSTRWERVSWREITGSL